MNFSDFRGCDALIGRLRDGVLGASPAHAYLFCGMPGTGRRTLAGICARALNCAAAGAKPCGVCPSCIRYLQGTHPDHIVLSSEKPLGVGDVRTLIDRVSTRPFEGGRHTVVIEDADRMTVQAQNALLKTLEEPPGDTVFFLIAATTASLLPTVRSRVRLIRFAPLPRLAVQEALIARGLAPDRAASLADVAEGSVGRALALDRDEAYWALRSRALAALSRLHEPGDVAACFAAIADDKSRALDVLDVLEQAALTALRCGALGETLPPDAPRLEAAALLMGLMNARRMLASNVSWQSAMETLLLDLLTKKRDTA